MQKLNHTSARLHEHNTIDLLYIERRQYRE